MARYTSWVVALFMLSFTSGMPENQGSNVIVVDDNTTSDGLLFNLMKSALGKQMEFPHILCKIYLANFYVLHFFSVH